ncbi:hypothetical protein DSM104299_02198 [Baekduia alba]|uniref:hypothetical protein n=1 Tax=Baekduia alba TaxID=2997333 RepID=UPI00233FE2A9|nr:hypothetical protein [Baekduia alba]WCB93485.1 hypothetical protein DSM104299_02198 [Baekduia alba]
MPSPAGTVARRRAEDDRPRAPGNAALARAIAKVGEPAETLHSARAIADQTEIEVGAAFLESQHHQTVRYISDGALRMTDPTNYVIGHSNGTEIWGGVGDEEYDAATLAARLVATGFAAGMSVRLVACNSARVTATNPTPLAHALRAALTAAPHNLAGITVEGALGQVLEVSPAVSGVYERVTHTAMNNNLARIQRKYARKLSTATDRYLQGMLHRTVKDSAGVQAAVRRLASDLGHTAPTAASFATNNAWRTYREGLAGKVRAAGDAVPEEVADLDELAAAHTTFKNLRVRIRRFGTAIGAELPDDEFATLPDELLVPFRDEVVTATTAWLRSGPGRRVAGPAYAVAPAPAPAPAPAAAAPVVAPVALPPVIAALAGVGAGGDDG